MNQCFADLLTAHYSQYIVSWLQKYRSRKFVWTYLTYIFYMVNK